MYRLSVVALAACGRIAFDPVAHEDPQDAAIDAPPQLLESITVLATGEIATSTTVLADGVTYQLIARGVCDISGVPNLEDAEYNFDAAMTTINDLGDNGATDTGLGIDDTVIDGDKFPKWGPYRPDHVYTLDFVGRGASITAELHDSAFGNNTGTLTLEIYQ